MGRAEGGSSRSSVVAAALALAAEEGWDATSLRAVRQGAGVSNGTLFHHFPTRADLASSVVATGMAEQQSALLLQLQESASVRQAVTGVVEQHLRWVADNQRLADLLLTAAPRTLRGGLPDGARQAHRGFFAEVARWLTAHGWSGTPDLTVMVSMWLGPAQYYARGRLAAPDDSLAVVAAALAGAAWRAVQPFLTEEDA